MMQIRLAKARGKANFGWLDSRHSFSFGHYYDPEHMGFGSLRVINEDRVSPARGFDPHSHQNMEILSYVLAGGLRHEDSMGNGSVIVPGDLQRMSAGTGIQHSEYNASDSESVHFLQIWIIPEREGLQPGYEQVHFADEQKQGQLCLIGSRDGRDQSVTIHQDVDLYATRLNDGETVEYAVAEDRRAWLQVAGGNASLNGQPLSAGDGVAIAGGVELSLSGESTEILLFDMG
ncbi:MAG: pirin family protein [Pseudomonadota bacterium]